jgi:CTP synthase (UTP-ammonia lyase)
MGAAAPGASEGDSVSNTRIALIGDYNASLTAHITIPPALDLAAKALNVDVEPVWVHTSKLTTKEDIRSLHCYDGIWCVPGPPYANVEGAISAISLARTEAIPFLGTCAGFQHALIEYFRNVVGVDNAAHAEVNAEAEHPIISRLSCSLVEVNGTVRLISGSLAQRLYGTDRVEEGYRCNYGLNPEFAPLLHNRDDIRIEGIDEAHEVRIVRLQHHPFFLATLFQPQRSSLNGLVHPLIREFVSVSARKGSPAPL